VREAREQQKLTQRELAMLSGVSTRFLAKLEAGEGNISVLRLSDLAYVLGTSAGELMADAEARHRAEPGVRVALLGLRGAGKSTIGPRLAERLHVPFFELDALVERAAGLSLGQIFELHGEAYYRRLERETLSRLLTEHKALVLATGGSIVTSPLTYRVLRRHFMTIWLRARPEDHWHRVVAQGDLRPMAQSPHAMAELRALLSAREPLYAQAHQILDTTKVSVEEAVASLARELGTPA
jgi:XRE family aerobic/anaerobic benzoate catabolism transcriptional regulator